MGTVKPCNGYCKWHPENKGKKYRHVHTSTKLSKVFASPCMSMYIALHELLHSNSVVFLCVDCVFMCIHTSTEMSCVPISSFHHSEEPIWASGRHRLPSNGVLRCHVSGVPVPGSGVGQSVLLLLQRPHQTTGVGVRVCVYACVGEVGCAYMQFGIRVYICV